MTKTSTILPDRDKVSWDWDVGEKKIVSTSYCSTQFEWIEEFQVSPDGEKIAMVAKVGGFEFSVCEKGDIWDPPYEKIWQLGYGPDGRLVGLVAQDGEWTVAVDGQTWDDTYGFLWNTMFSGDGKVIAVAAQQDMKYGMVVDGKPWKQFFENANQFTLSRKGDKSAAVVQTTSLAQADIQTFQNGCYTVAVDGEPWKRNFVNTWTPVFSPDGNRVAAQVRTSLYDYTVAVDGQTWAQGYTGVWTPLFSPDDGAVIAPVRERGKWGMARNGELIWKPMFDQCWHQGFSDDGQNLWAIVAPKYGHFTLAQNGQPWKTCFPVVTDLVVGPSGTRAAALAKDDKDQWSIITDDTVWPGKYAMAWPAVFSPDGHHLAAKVERNSRYTFVVNGREWGESYDQAWNPVFSPDGDKLMLRYIKDDAYFRRVVRLEDFKG
jgi:hypothetical protein